MPTVMLEKFFAELGQLFDSANREAMTPRELRIATILVDEGYGWWADDGTFRP